MDWDLLNDPFPSQKWDSHRWQTLFRLIVLRIEDRQQGYMLLRRMWTLRSFGTLLRRDMHGIKLVPLLDPEGAWPDMEFWEFIRDKYLMPHSAEIKYLIGLLEENTE